MFVRLLIAALMATAVAAQGIGFGSPVLPANFQQPIAGQLTQPVLTPQQAQQLIPNNALQAQLNQRVAATAGGAGLMPVNYGAVGLGGFGGQPQQLGGIGGVQQQQVPFQGIGGIQQQQPYLGTIGGVGGIQQPMLGNIGGVGGIPQQQQQPMLGNIGGIGGFQQQQPMQLGNLGGVGLGQQPFQQVPGVGVQQFAQQPFMQGIQQPFMQGVQQPMMQPMGMF